MNPLVIRRDPNETKYNAILRLPRDGNPNYYDTLFMHARRLFRSLGRFDLEEDLDLIIREKFEKFLNMKMSTVLMLYKNQTDMKGIIYPKNPLYSHRPVYKHEIRDWLTEVEIWINDKVDSLEPQIRFTSQPVPYF